MPWPSGNPATIVSITGSRAIFSKYEYKTKEYGAAYAALESCPGLKFVQAENVPRIGHVVVPVAQNKPDFRQQKRNQDGVDPHVPDFVGVEAGARRLPTGPPKSGQH